MQADLKKLHGGKCFSWPKSVALMRVRVKLKRFRIPSNQGEKRCELGQNYLYLSYISWATWFCSMHVKFQMCKEWGEHCVCIAGTTRTSYKKYNLEWFDNICFEYRQHNNNKLYTSKVLQSRLFSSRFLSLFSKFLNVCMPFDSSQSLW